MKLRASDHAVTRYWERVKPALLRDQAAAELNALVASGRLLPARPDWLEEAHARSDGYLELSDGIVGGVVEDCVTTILVRASTSPERRARKKAARQARRKAKRAHAQDNARLGRRDAA